MSTMQKSGPTVPQPGAQPGDPVTPPVSRIEGAGAMIASVEAIRQQIPAFSFPVVMGDRRPLNNLKSVPPDFIEQTNVALKGETLLSRGGVDVEEVRDLVNYALAYRPVADVLERAALEMRKSVDTAMAKAGKEALTTYALAQRLALDPNTGLAPLVQNMRTTLGRGGKKKKAATNPTTQPANPVAPPVNPTATSTHAAPELPSN